MIDSEVIKRALKLIRKGAANYEYFFDRLDSPEWLEPLRQEGFFAHPRPAERQGNTVRYPRWPESQYLARMASVKEAQESVLAIALNIPDTDNVRVHEDLADVALNLPPHLAARFVSKAKTWLRAEHHLSLPEKLGKLMIHLANGRQFDAALELGRALLAIVPKQTQNTPDDEDEEFRLPPSPSPRFDEWAYGKILEEDVPILVETIGESALDMLCDVLEAAAAIRGTETENGFWDYSSVWRPAIEDHKQNRPHEIRSRLVTAVRKAAESLVRRDPGNLVSIVTRFESRRWPIFHRLALHLLRCSQSPARDLVAERLTDRSRFENTTLHHEYALLAQKYFSKLADQDQETILGWIEEGPNLENWKAYWEEEKGQAPTEEEAQKYKRAWQRNQLALIKDSLSDEWLRYYESLIQEFGEAKHPEFLVYSEETWVGPTSPKSSEELRSMELEALVEYLRHWEPPGGWRSPSPEGLGRVLEEVVESDPERFATGALRFQGLDPTYVRALISGLRNAARKGRAFSWEPVLELAQWVVEQEREIPGREGEYSDLDPGWVWTRKSLADLLAAGLDAGRAEIPFGYREEVWDILLPLTDDPDPTPEDEARYGGSNMDPATLSINTVRGEAMHALMRYALWVHRHTENSAEGGDSPSQGFDRMPEVRKVLELHLRPERDPSLAIRAVYGQWFPWLVLIDTEWAKTRKDEIFPAVPTQADLRQAAWDAYVVFCQPYDSTAELLEEEYGRALDHLNSPTGEGSHLRDPANRLTEHLMQLYWRGKLALDEDEGLLQRFYANAGDTLRGYAIEFIGRSLLNTDGEISTEIVARLQALWEYRLATVQGKTGTLDDYQEEMSAFGWWFASGKFDLHWSLGQLRAVLDIVGSVEPDHLVLERLAEIAPDYPMETVHCLGNMLADDDESWRVIGHRDEIRSILKSAHQSNIPEATALAEELIHRLGARGYREFRDLIR